MAKRNRITIEIAENGDILGICSDRPADVYLISNHGPGSRIHKYSPELGVVTFGARAVDASLDPPGTAWEAKRWSAADKASSASTKSPESIDWARQLARIRDLLVKHRAEGKLIDAIDQIIAEDNERSSLEQLGPDLLEATLGELNMAHEAFEIARRKLGGIQIGSSIQYRGPTGRGNVLVMFTNTAPASFADLVAGGFSVYDQKGRDEIAARRDVYERLGVDYTEAHVSQTGLRAPMGIGEDPVEHRHPRRE